MTIGFSPQLTRLVKRFESLFAGRRKGAPGVPHETCKFEEIKDIDNVVETFNSLVTQLSRDGGHLGDLYVKAERRAARFALLSETVVDSVSSGILVVEDTGQITLANSAAGRILRAGREADLAGKRLAELLDDATEMQTLVAEAFRDGVNASRRILAVRARDGRRLCLGASTSCVVSPQGKVEAVIVLFTELAQAAAGDRPGADQPDSPQAMYLRGVLDCYDHFSSVAREIEKVQAKIDKGSLSTSDIADCVSHTKRSWEIMSAFAMTLVARDSLSEIVDLAAAIKSVVTRRKELEHVKVSQPINGLLRVMTVRKVFEAGLELLLLGCVEDAPGQVVVAADLAHEPQGDSVHIKITEQSPKSHLLPIGQSLRGFETEVDMRREAGIMLLRSLSGNDYRVLVDEEPEALTFRLVLKCHADSGAGPAAEMGDVSERGPDGI